ncbi:streptophobe family protein [Streptomyces gelaticus]
MPAAPPPPVPPGSPWRHALEGALSVATAAVAMAAAAWGALTLLGADAVAPLSRLVPMTVSMAFGGGVTMESASSSESADSGESGGGLGGLLGGLGGGGGMSLGLTGEAALTPLTLTFLGMAVLAIAFFRPLRRRQRPAPALLWARCGGALVTTAVVFPVIAVMAQGTAQLPKSVTERFGKGASSGAFSQFTGGGGGGGGGGLTKGLSSVMFETDAGATAFLGLLWVSVVLAAGCVAARRTTLPRPLALSRMRLKWNAVTSTLTGTAAVLCCSALAVALLAAAADLTGQGPAAKAAGVLLLASPNLIAVLLTTGLGASWEAGMHRLQSDGGGMLGGTAQGETAGTDKSVDLGGWSGAGVPLWLIAMVLIVLLLTIAGYTASARTPTRTPREDSEALLARHAEIALRMGIAVGIAALALPLAARGSVRIGITLMGNEMGGMAAGLDDGLRLSPLTGFVLAALATYGGSRLQNRRARRRSRVAQPTTTTTRRPAAARSTTRVPSDSAP